MNTQSDSTSQSTPASKPSITLYGIANCDTVKKARTWLTDNDLPYEFHDFKKGGLPEDRLQQWCRALGWETVLNRKGTTWRTLNPETQAAAASEAGAIALMLEHTSAVKRPIVEWRHAGEVTVTAGFSPEAWAALAG